MRKGFTLIELLVVVTIIAILALIAVPNSQEAQTRAKVSAVKNNMRIVAMAIEMCATDTNSYPKAVTWNVPCKVLFEVNDCTSSLLSMKYDLFLPQTTTGNLELLFGDLVYFNHSMMIDLLEVQGITWDEATTETWIRAKADAGEWSLHSVGPDRVLEGPNWVRMAAVADTASAPYANSDGWTSWCDGSTTGISPCTSPPHEYTDWAYFRDYDPTNGTVSEGNIFRTQRSTAGFGVDPYYYRRELPQ